MTQIQYGFIIGCDRSGTSILGELFSTAAKTYYQWETRNVWQTGESDISNYEEEVKNGVSSHCMTELDYSEKDASRIHALLMEKIATLNTGKKSFDILRPTIKRINNTVTYMEKTPRNSLRIPYIHRILPEARFVNIIRDGRDVACSMIPGIGGDEWRHSRPDNWEELFALPQIERCLLAWKTIVERIDNDLKNIPGELYTNIHYEDLVNDPVAVARKVFGFLQIPFKKKQKEFCTKIQNETANSYHAAISEKWFRPNHSVRVGRWRENLTEEQQEIIHGLIGNTLKYFGYELTVLS